MDKGFNLIEDILLRNLHFLKKPLSDIQVFVLANGFKGLEKKIVKNSGNSM